MPPLLNVLKDLFPYQFRQTLKRKLFHVNDMHARLTNLRRAGFSCSGIIDGGAYVGDWTTQFWRVFPGVPSIIVEPLPEKKLALEKVAVMVKGSMVAFAALGAEPARARFRLGETNSSLISGSEKVNGNVIEVEVVTIDNLLERSSFKPNLLKLDLQGFELEALKGCRALSEKFEVIVIEVSVLRIGDVPIFNEVDNYLEREDFRLYDIIPQYYRPLDGALWQCDAIYVRKASNLLQSRDWI